MPFSDKGTGEDVESLVDTLNTLNEANLSTLTSTDIQQLAELSHELHLTSSEMETDATEVIIDSLESEHEVIESEIGAHEVEIETERAPTPEEILPDVKSPKAITVPPLRPLNIAPKPTKVPLTMKPVQGQQLLVLQGSGGGQSIKLVTTGQELNLQNFQIGRPVTLKPATVKTQMVQPKMFMKRVVTASGHQRLVKSSHKQVMMVQKSVMPTPTKTITLKQAQEMGLLSPSTKIISQGQSKQTLVLNKSGGGKTIKLVPTHQMAPQMVQATPTSSAQKLAIKSPAKILPATIATTSTPSSVPVAKQTQQRFIFKSASGAILPQAQLIPVANSQTTLSPGQLHQINIPGKGVQYIKFVTNDSPKTTVQSGQNLILTAAPSASTTPSTGRPVKLATRSPIGAQQLVMLPNYVHHLTSSSTPKVPIPAVRHPSAPKLPTSPPTLPHPPPPIPSSPNSDMNNLESNGMRPRKPCNCTKSQCLKLYCDCFANGEFCFMCNCVNCYNNLENEDHRQRAIKNCLERNPSAFRPKIGKAKDNTGDASIRKHTKGCNCKRSGCLKNYCECYEAKIACSNNCKCVGCRNVEDAMDIDSKAMLSHALDELYHVEPKIVPKELQVRPRRTSSTRQAINFITDDVIEATSQCMLTIGDGGEAQVTDEEVIKSQIIEEFGRCLKEIIDYSALN